MEYSLYILAYLIGSIPFGLLLTKIAGHGDIRDIGSGNIGATNVLRTGNKFLALMTLLLDVLKAIVPLLILRTILPHAALTPMLLPIGLFIIIGHCYPVWLKFKGGKGVATTLGVLLAIVPYAGLAACATWLLSAFLFRISSLAALMAVAVAPVVTFFVYGQAPASMCVLIMLLVWVRHKDNIKRLMKGEEPRIGKKNEPAQE